MLAGLVNDLKTHDLLEKRSGNKLRSSPLSSELMAWNTQKYGLNSETTWWFLI